MRKVGQNSAQHVTAAPLLKVPMHRLVIRIALRQSVPLRARVHNLQHRFEHCARGHGLAPWAILGKDLLGEMLPNPSPLFVAQAQHKLNPINSRFVSQ